jgi:hypothetical protein
VWRKGARIELKREDLASLRRSAYNRAATDMGLLPPVSGIARSAWRFRHIPDFTVAATAS